MSLSMRRIFAIVRKDRKDSMKSANIVPVLLIPVGMALMFAYVMPSDLDMMFEMYVGVILLNLLFISGVVPANSLAEEKEKGTLRMLLYTPTSIAELLIGKNIHYFCLSLIGVLLSLLILQVPISWGYFLVAVIPVAFFCIVLSSTVGLLANNNGQIMITLFPVIMGMYFISSMADLYNVAFIYTIKRFLPIEIFYDAFYVSYYGGSFPWFSLVVTLCWITVISIIFAVVYRKQRYT
ncbi:hypothetical protein DH09_15730 [Bacillaceae bacterium JMAK1]|nr:hypothetical protein DH09_15730 [Bacillaceae bacterium JMAK1]